MAIATRVVMMYMASPSCCNVLVAMYTHYIFDLELEGNIKVFFVNTMLLWEKIRIMAMENYGDYYYMES
jgi:hypothetical protein